MRRLLLRAAGAAALFMSCWPAAGAADSDIFHRLERHAWYLPAADKAAQLYVTSLGQGPKVVVLHGGPGANFYYMVGAVEPLLDRYQFVLFDQRGSLLSPDKGKLEDLGIDDLVEDLEALRLALGEDKLTLFAHSMGTRLAIEYIRHYPDHVAKLVMIGAVPPRSGPAADMDAMTKRGYAMLERPAVAAQLEKEGLAKLDPKTATPQQATRFWRVRFAAVNMVHVDRWHQMEGGRAFYNGAVGGQLSGSFPADYDLAEFAGDRAIPISIVQGDQDYVDPGASAWRAFQKDKAPLARCVDVTVLKDGGHLLWGDDPDGVKAAMVKGLARDGC